MRSLASRFALTAALTLVVLPGNACSGADAAGPPQPASLDEFVTSLPAWSTYSPPIPSGDAPTGPPTDQVDQINGAPHACTVTPHSLTSNPEAIVTLNPDVEILWVGSLLQGDGYVGGIGSLAELPIRQRSPVTLSIDLLAGNNSKTVENPTLATINSAIGSLISDAQTAGHQSGSNIFFTKETAFSLTQASLKMGLSAKYMGNSITANLSSKISDEKRSVTAYFVQRMFTVSMVLPQNPGDVFSDDFTQDMLEHEQSTGRMAPDNPPVFVSSVAYGRILMFTFTSTASVDSVNLAVNALYNQGGFGGGADLEAGLNNILQQAEIQVVTVGGDAESALALIKSNDLGSFFTDDAPLTTARPISYTVRNLKDNGIAVVSETTNYNLKSCTRMPPTGAEYNVQLTHLQAITDAEGHIYYTFYTGGSAGPTQSAFQASTILVANMPHIDQGGIHLLNGKPANGVNVVVHFDGTDKLAITGAVHALIRPSVIPNPAMPYGPYNFSREFKGAGAKDLNGQYSTDGVYQGTIFPVFSRLRLFFTITKVGDVYE